MFLLRNLTLLPLLILAIINFLDAVTDGGFSILLRWMFFICMGLSSVGGMLVNYYFRCKSCGKRALFVDDGDLFGKRNYFACRCMNCGAPLKGQ
ncbi:hypothetical protein CK621_06000 [Vandammella animalimorsus]|uniref:Uncharacterized protein n=1 Tax=Vandammella animalimorsus TaxID=2029117 RepID=A0A2A2AZ88_9BURK|nr:hypothetical protein CK621_06000 [Vandammella animalimorsus]